MLKQPEAVFEKALRTLREVIYGMTVYDWVYELNKARNEQERLFTLIVYGEKDSVIDPEPARMLNGRRPDLRPIGLGASRHFPMLDEANKFNRLLKDFLETDDLTGLALKEEWKRRTR